MSSDWKVEIVGTGKECDLVTGLKRTSVSHPTWWYIEVCKKGVWGRQGSQETAWFQFKKPDK